VRRNRCTKAETPAQASESPPAFSVHPINERYPDKIADRLRWLNIAGDGERREHDSFAEFLTREAIEAGSGAG
jgi:hypothetical protein